MIISQLEFGPQVMELEQKHYSICILLAKWFNNPIGEHHDTCFTYPFIKHSSKSEAQNKVKNFQVKSIFSAHAPMFTRNKMTKLELTPSRCNAYR